MEATGALPTRRCAVVIDEAHSSQGGETATALKEVLSGKELREEARRRAVEEGMEDDAMEALFLSMAKRGRQANLSFLRFYGDAETQDVQGLSGATASPHIATPCAKRSRRASSSTC